MRPSTQLIHTIGVIFLLAAPMAAAITGLTQPGNPAVSREIAYRWHGHFQGLESEDYSGTLLIATDGEHIANVKVKPWTVIRKVSGVDDPT